MSLFALECGAEPHLAHHDAGVSSNARAMEVVQADPRRGRLAPAALVTSLNRKTVDLFDLPFLALDRHCRRRSGKFEPEPQPLRASGYLAL